MHVIWNRFLEFLEQTSTTLNRLSLAKSRPGFWLACIKLLSIAFYYIGWTVSVLHLIPEGAGRKEKEENKAKQNRIERVQLFFFI